MKKAFVQNYYINDDTHKPDRTCWKLELECLGKLGCINMYKVVSWDNPTFVNGELFHDLKQNTMTLSFNGRNFYNDKPFSYTSVLNKCNNKWRGSAIYTEGLPGESGITEFWFAK